MPEEEGGLGFRLLQDMNMALFCKLWWNFRPKFSIWSTYLYNKYCKKEHPNMVMWKIWAGSLVWKRCCKLET